MSRALYAKDSVTLWQFQFLIPIRHRVNIQTDKMFTVQCPQKSWIVIGTIKKRLEAIAVSLR